MAKLKPYSTKAFIGRGKDAAEARDEAKYFEEQILKNATSAEEYQQLCDELLATTVQTGPKTTDPQLAVEADEILNPDGPMFGNYSCATFHQDGQMSTIFKARALDASAPVAIVALKVTHPASMQPPHNAEREARILKEARHEFVMPLLESFWYDRNQLVLVFPFMRQDLENLLRSGTLTRAQRPMVFHGLFSALAYVHSLNIIHRDIKPSNILLRSMDGPVYLADFGIAWSPLDPASEPAVAKITDIGTANYRPPEVLFGDRSYDTSLDMWAAGCVVVEMMRQDHRQLFDAGPLGSELGLIKSIFTTLGTPDESVWPSVTRLPDWDKVRFQQFPPQPWATILPNAIPEAVDFVQKTVCYETSARLTAAEALRHPYKGR